MDITAERCDARFLHGWFELTDLSQFANVSAVPSITGSRLKRVLVTLPPLPEQRAIAAVLDSIDEAIERTEAVIASLRAPARHPAPRAAHPRRPRLALRVEGSPRHRDHPRLLGGGAVG